MRVNSQKSKCIKFLPAHVYVENHLPNLPSCHPNSDSESPIGDFKPRIGDLESPISDLEV